MLPSLVMPFKPTMNDRDQRSAQTTHGAGNLNRLGRSVSKIAVIDVNAAKKETPSMADASCEM
jgi:hypothetical protein